MTREQALTKLAGLVDYLAVTEETLEAPGDPPEWTWAEQHDLSESLKAIAAALAAPPSAPTAMPLTMEQVELHGQYVVDCAADHDDDCPGDDTCECWWKARNDAVNAVCRYLDAITRTREPRA